MLLWLSGEAWFQTRRKLQSLQPKDERDVVPKAPHLPRPKPPAIESSHHRLNTNEAVVVKLGKYTHTLYSDPVTMAISWNPKF